MPLTRPHSHWGRWEHCRPKAGPGRMNCPPDSWTPSFRILRPGGHEEAWSFQRGLQARRRRADYQVELSRCEGTANCMTTCWTRARPVAPIASQDLPGSRPGLATGAGTPLSWRRAVACGDDILARQLDVDPQDRMRMTDIARIRPPQSRAQARQERDPVSRRVRTTAWYAADGIHETRGCTPSPVRFS